MNHLHRHRLALSSLLVLSLLPLSAAGADDPPFKEPPAPRIIVPAYFYPAGEGLELWERMIDSPAAKRTIAIVNPASGPGKNADANYEQILPPAQKAGLTLIGYVSSSYAKRPLAELKADVDTWLKLYPQITGIFFDEQASGGDQLDYYAELYRYVREEKKLSLVVTNPGTVCVEGYFQRPATDVACLFEGPWKQGCLKFPAWTRAYASRIYALPYQTPDAATMKKIHQEVRERNFGYSYITDRAGANPWDGLPVWWDEWTKMFPQGAQPPAGQQPK